MCDALQILQFICYGNLAILNTKLDMFCDGVCLRGSNCMEKVRDLSDALNAEVVDRINGSQQLVMLSNFSCESQEYRFKKSVQDRISDVSSWRWVLEDLTKRLNESIEALKHEHNALRVVAKRIQDEIDCHSREGSLPGALAPLTDSVEESILQEYNFLREQKKNFEKLILELDKQTNKLEKTKKKIAEDVLNKEQAIAVDEMCVSKDYQDVVVKSLKKRKKGPSLTRWVHRSDALKRAGLRALCNAVITRQQVRESRIQLSIAAQAHATKVDASLRRRLHSNSIKLQDLNWQRQEAVRDYQSLDEELMSSEKSLVDTMNKTRIVEARLGDRFQRPVRELTKDDVNRQLREELWSLKTITKNLRNNIGRITSLQNNLSEAIASIDTYTEDLLQVISLDEDRIRGRLCQDDGITRTISNDYAAAARGKYQEEKSNTQLTVIQEEIEDDDYPFDD